MIKHLGNLPKLGDVIVDKIFVQGKHLMEL
ncbi:hypothetical protein NTGHW29_370014 [Candidatus Nitrotoga sp. HW29]|nr:hypothetical protein NTGHW29_370014 [Candidatus Nitrotoga sp. HW29]